MEKIRLIIGLGNPGKKYQKTRHNLGFRVIDFLINHWNAKLEKSQSSSETVLAKVYRPERIGAGKDLSSQYPSLAKPLTYVNLSGNAVKKLLKRYKIKPEEILVISDDFSLPFGTIRIRQAGSAGGHKGLESIITALGTKKFPRLRIGCGPLPQGIDPKDYVLSPLTKEEENKFILFLPKVSEAIKKICTVGLEKVMSLYNIKIC